jgi:predicted nucleic acid-binding protein
MRYLLDSDTLSDFFEVLSTGHEGIAAGIASLGEVDEICLSILTIFEHEYGRAKAPEDKKLEIAGAIEMARKEFKILPLSIEAARVYGELKAALTEARGLGKKSSRSYNIDLMIAATAIVEDSILVSSDAVYKELRKSHPALVVENWSQSSS